MASNVNLTITNHRLTGTNVSVAQRAADTVLTWTDDSNQPHTDSRTVLFPNLLNNAALPTQWVQDNVEDLLYRALRIIVGIDTP